jgi:hypothetical protein
MQPTDHSRSKKRLIDLTSSTEWRQILLQHTGQTNKAVQKKKSGWLCLGVVTLHGNARLQIFGPFQK